MDTILGFDAIGFWIVFTGALVNISGALLGNYLVLRKMSLMGDAISHAVLPGLAIAFLVTQSRGALPMLAGALLAGLLTILLTETIRRYAGVAEDASIGVVFTSMFALGVVLISRAASQVDLDPGCVLYGILESAALDTHPLFGVEVPYMALHLAIVTLAVIGFVLLFWKELKLVSFDPALATTLGFRTTLVHYLLMAMVAAFSVVAFEAVGSILVVAMLVAPSATAYLLTDRLKVMALLAPLIGISSAFLGRELAFEFETPVAGAMAVAVGLHFVLAVFFAPRHGLLARKIYQFRVGFRVLREDILALLFRWEERRPSEGMTREELFRAMAGNPALRPALVALRFAGELESGDGTFRLSDAGRKAGGKLIRKHRLWESYLAKHTPLPSDHLHDPADRVEHYISGEMVDAVAREVGFPDTDPHGKPIGDFKKG